MALEGKGIYIWRIQQCEGGDPVAIRQRAVEAGFSHVLLKIADGTLTYNQDLARPVANELRAAGIEVWGWHYVYGVEPLGEADIAVQRTDSLDLDGYVVNAEDPYKGRGAAASAFMESLVNRIPGVPIALSSFRYPLLHGDFPWTEFLSLCTYNMPQVYWIQADNPAEQLDASIEQFQQVYPIRDIIPTGSAYEEAGWRARPEDVTAFLTHARSIELAGVNFWSWDYAGSAVGTDLWNAIANFNWPTGDVQPDITDRLVAALNRADVEAVLSLYADDAVLTTRTRTYRGQAALRAHFQALLIDVSTFNIETRVEEGWVRRIRWDASGTRSISNAQDALQVSGGKIHYHSTTYNTV